MGHLSRRFVPGKTRSPGCVGVGGVGAGSGAGSGADIADTLGETFCHNHHHSIALSLSGGLKESRGGLG